MAKKRYRRKSVRSEGVLRLIPDTVISPLKTIPPGMVASNMIQQQRQSGRHQLFSVLIEGKTYLNILFSLLLLPISILIFTISITLLALSLGLMASLFYAPFGTINLGSYLLKSLPWRILASLCFAGFGFIMLVISMHIINWMMHLTSRMFSHLFKEKSY